MRIVPQSVELLSITKDAAKLIELAGRVCWKSEDRIEEGSAERFIEGTILTKNHLSVIEHASASFRVICDRGVSHEAVRHRVASYSQESTRYCNYSKEKYGREITVIKPPGLTPEATVAWEVACQVAEKAYFDMLDAGAKPQIARSILPTCLKTEFVWTANFREWLHVIDLRTSAAAHPQMQEVAGLIAKILARECPVIFQGRSNVSGV